MRDFIRVPSPAARTITAAGLTKWLLGVAKRDSRVFTPAPGDNPSPLGRQAVNPPDTTKDTAHQPDHRHRALI
ncbi:hypothetical protein GCM10010468_13730 [Actinocorallia longicatena]|uniref:Uncharacterized protein n=1 Tax=Actinocorallia longicatena TaxID=111803 RepID=A0ABP6Q265_9ACTN